MACRVGMSTTPYERIVHWMEKEGHSKYEILASHLTFDEALKREKAEALARGCHYRLGGKDNGLDNWSIYLVSGGTIG